MRYIWHQFRTDWEHLRWWVVALWLGMAVQAALAWLFPPAELTYILRTLLLALEAILAGWVTLRVIHADPLVGSNAFWQTRPIRRPHLFAAKTLFLALLVGIPFLLPVLVHAVRLNLGPGQFASALLEALVYAGNLLLLVAVLAGLTNTVFRFLAAAGYLVLVWICWTFLIELWRSRIGLPDPEWAATQNMRLATALTVLLFCASAGWLLQGLLARQVPAWTALFGGVVALPVIANFWPVPAIQSRAPAITSRAVQLLDAKTPLAEPPGTQVLWSHFKVTGLASGEVVIVRNMQATFSTGKNRAATFSYIDPLFSGSREWLRSPGVYDRLKRFYPEVTVWGGYSGVWRQTTLPTFGDIPQNLFQRANQGRWQGQLEVVTAGLRRVADLPLSYAAVEIKPGHRLDLRRIEADTTGLRLRLFESKALSLFSPQPADLPFRVRQRGSELAFVLFHPSAFEALVADSHMAGSFDFPMLQGERTTGIHLNFPFPRLRSVLTGLSPEAWAAEARLHVYDLDVREQFDWEFDRANFAFVPGRESGRFAADSSPGLEAVTLPADPTAAQISSYLDTVFGSAPDSLDSRLRQSLQAKVMAIGSAGLPVLLKKLPVEREMFYAAVRPALSKLSTREHLPALREALERNPDLAWLFLEKGWVAEGREPLSKHLKNRGETLDPAALKVLAGAQNSQECPDLLWHWTANQQGAPDIFLALNFCASAERKQALELGWKRARFGLKDRHEIAALAAAEGLPESLAVLVDRLAQRVDPRQRERELAPLIRAMPFSGKPEDFPAWLNQNAHQLQWEPTTKRYRLLN